MTDAQPAYDSGSATEQLAPAGVTDHQDGRAQTRSPEPDRYVDSGLGEEAPEAEPRTAPTLTDPQVAHDSEVASEQIAPAGVTEHEDSGPHAPTPEPERYVDNGVTEEAAEARPGTASLDAEELTSVRSRWREIQAYFVDEPRSAVQDADALVAELVQRLARMFAAERDELESRWARQTNVSTEDLRQDLQCYRSFFQRLVAALTSADPGPSAVARHGPDTTAARADAATDAEPSRDAVGGYPTRQHSSTGSAK